MLERHIKNELQEYLNIMPVVLLSGARQTGKTTLAKSLRPSYQYVTFDDDMILSNAKRDPAGWLSQMPKPIILDEIQRVPEIFLAIKKDVDENREAGRYLLTGSANPLLLPNLSDSLAGRMGIVNLYPFSQGELLGKKEKFIDKIFSSKIEFQEYDNFSFEELYEIYFKGGFPPVQLLNTEKDVSRWILSYLQTIMSKDIRDITNIEKLSELPNLFKLLATRSSMLINFADLSRSLGMVNMTLRRYLRLLEILFFVYLLPPWFSNMGKRITKSPKLHLCDIAMLKYLLDVDKNRLIKNPTYTGPFLENFVFTEFLKQKSWNDFNFDIFHFRDGNHEVDFVLEKQDGTIIGIEVKSAKTLQKKDFSGLLYLKKIAKEKFKRGIILHLGNQIQPVFENIWAMPIQSLWS